MIWPTVIRLLMFMWKALTATMARGAWNHSQETSRLVERTGLSMGLGAEPEPMPPGAGGGDRLVAPASAA